MNKDIVQRERDFHNQLYKDGAHPNESIRSPILFAYIANLYSRNLFKNLEKVNSKKILDVGCGRGIGRAKTFISNNCDYTGIDISEESIFHNIEEASMLNIKADFRVEDANTLSSLKGNMYDLIILTGTLHHLDIKVFMKNVKEITSSNGGKVIMNEPMGTNPFINLFRFLTPKLRSPDEHPLNFDDFKLIKKYFKNSIFELHTITSILSIPFALIPSKRVKKFGQKLSILLGKFDTLISKLPLIKRLSWIVLITAES